MKLIISIRLAVHLVKEYTCHFDAFGHITSFVQRHVSKWDIHHVHTTALTATAICCHFAYSFPSALRIAHPK